MEYPSLNQKSKDEVQPFRTSKNLHIEGCPFIKQGMKIIYKGVFFLLLSMNFLFANEAKKVVDITSLKGLWLTGYQAWARTPNDGTNSKWQHYFVTYHTGERVWVVDGLPDTSEFKDEDKELVDDVFDGDGNPVYLVSAINPNVIDTHFKWMRDYDIDGVWLQRFLMSSLGQEGEKTFSERNKIMDEVVKASKKYGRGWAINFDLVDIPAEKLVDEIKKEWIRMVDLGYTTLENRYIHHNGLPVVHLWNVTYPDDVELRSKSNPQIAEELLEFFNTKGKYQAFFVAGTNWTWTREVNIEKWEYFYEEIKCVVSWNVGNALPDKNDPNKFVAYTGIWKDAERISKQKDILWIPTIYPSFSWQNMNVNRTEAWAKARKGRRQGEFLWEQLYALNEVNADSVFLAMWDELDEWTAFFKVLPNPPEEGNFLGTEGMPSDWSLQLVREARRIMRSNEPFPKTIPSKLIKKK